MQYKKIAILSVPVLLIAAGPVFAVVDTTAIETELDELTTYMTTVGGTLITAAATALGFKWIKGAIFS